MDRQGRWWRRRLMVAGAVLALAGCADATRTYPDGGTTSSSSGGGGGMGGGTSSMSATGTGGTSTASTSSSSSGGAPVLTGTFVGGAVSAEAGAIRLQGQITWHAKVSGESGGIKLEGWLR